MTTQITLEALTAIETPQATSTWQPVPHAFARRNLLDALVDAGLPVSDERILTDKDGEFAYGVFSLDVDTQDRSWNPEALWVNCHGKSRAYTLGLGERTWACSNGQVFAETVLKTKRTTGIFSRMGDLATEFVAMARGAIVTNEQRREAYASHLIGENWAKVLTVQVAEAGVIPSSKIMPVLAEFTAPSFEYQHRADTLLGLQAAVTDALKAYGPAGQHDRSLKLLSVLDKEANLV